MTTETAARKALAIAEVIRDYWEVEFPKTVPNYPFVNPGEEEGVPPPEQKKLRKFLTRLGEDTLYKIAMIRYLGRHAFDTRNLPGEYRELRKDFATPSELVSFLSDQTALADDLEEGLAILKAHRIDLDRMDLTAAEV